ncbi:MAG TPA: molybdenum cofactor biosynthesis protein B [Nitrososphaerales archaeon]|nr:molybdenum cofactor biosynthesis protein B [Nitrososphaerales archaeon]
MKPHEEHRHRAPEHLKVRIVTVSTSRYASMQEGKKFTDEGGDLAESEAKKGGHSVTGRALVSDDKKMIRLEMTKFLSGGDDVMIFTGGTGVAKRDVTVEAVRPYFEKELVGFGELFRRLSFEDVGFAGILSRATAGIVKGKVVLCLPGSPAAVKLALGNFVGELPHLVFVARS